MPLLNPRAVAFDLDGILVDTEPIFVEAIRRYLAPRGLAFDAEFMHTMMGAPAAQSVPRFRERYRLSDSIEVIAMECRDLFVKALGDQPGPLMPGVHEIVTGLRERQVPFCIATSSGSEFVRRVFGPHGLLDHFHFVLTCEDVKRGKPHPEVYELAATRFAIAPDDMLVFEDSPNGLRAAKAAGARCVVVPHQHTPLHLLDEADLIVPGLNSDELRAALGW
jgi:HAD superfamily hydrolase (TIGR01509 family)